MTDEELASYVKAIQKAGGKGKGGPSLGARGRKRLTHGHG